MDSKRGSLRKKIMYFCKDYGRRYQLMSPYVRSFLARQMAEKVANPAISHKAFIKFTVALEEALRKQAQLYNGKNLKDTIIYHMFARDITESVIEFYEKKD